MQIPTKAEVNLNVEKEVLFKQLESHIGVREVHFGSFGSNSTTFQHKSSY